MNKQTRLVLLIQIILLAIPIFFWEHIKNETIKFSMALFIVFFYGYTFFRIFESFVQQEFEKKNGMETKNSFSWIGIIMQIFVLVLFYTYSKRIYEILT
jgi:L-cystine uptake protein TcyP (sodium:dicarboxylate symporter family)